MVEETGEPGENQRPVACHWQGLLFSVGFVHITCSRHEIHVAEKNAHLALNQQSNSLTYSPIYIIELQLLLPMV